MKGLDTAHLAAFAAVVEEGSFEAAAGRLHVTPSAVSQRIKALEARMGRVLVRRTRPCRATDAGAVLARLAGQIALLEGDALAELTGDSAEPASTLRMPVAVNADSLATWFLPALAAVAAPHRVSFDIRQEDQDHSVALLRDGTVMAAVTADPGAVQGCTADALGSMRYLAVAAPSFHRRFFANGVTADALSAAPMLIFNRKDALQGRFARMLAGRDVEPPMTYLPSSRGFADAARLGLAWGMVPEQMAKPAVEAGDLVELAPDRCLDVPLYWQRWRLDSPTLGALTRAVKDTAAQTLQPGEPRPLT